MEQGFQYVLEKVKGITTEPGCYLMKNAEGEIFYIGKAKNLRARLKSYFLGTDTRLFVQYLEHILFDVDILAVRNDIEALILERELIKKFKPRFNIMLKDDKNYILLKLKRPKASGKKKEVYPRLEIVRQTRKDNAKYYGPFPSAGRLRSTINLINKHFMLRTCNDQVIENRSRPCIQYQIGRCLAPCVYEVPEYCREVDNVNFFLSGNFQEIIKRLTAKMWELSQNEQYEAAARVRDQIRAVETSLTTQVVSQVNQRKDQDVVGLARHGPQLEFVIIKVRQGLWQNSDNIAVKDQPFPTTEVLRAFLHQTYLERQPEELPHNILIPMSISSELSALEDELSRKAKHKVSILAPSKGKAKKLLDIAVKNATIALEDRLKNQNASEQGLLGLQEKLGLAIKPKRIECIDISILQGTDAYGSVVVFIDGRPEKKLYRTYKIKNVSGMDDFKMIHEVVLRRIKRGIKEGDLPDLLLIDGGKGQLKSALQAIESQNLLVSRSGLFVASIAKARALKETSMSDISVKHSSERLFTPQSSHSIPLNPHSFETHLVENIRDEAHRFALKSHRRSRKKRIIKSRLLDIPGIGKKRALLLLRHFKSTKAIAEASYTQVAEVAKIGLKKAQEVIDFLRT